jgi:hypothetical protein
MLRHIACSFKFRQRIEKAENDEHCDQPAHNIERITGERITDVECHVSAAGHENAKSVVKAVAFCYELCPRDKPKCRVGKLRAFGQADQVFFCVSLHI